MSSPDGSIFDKIVQDKEGHVIMDGVNSHFEFNTTEKLKNLPTKTDLTTKEITTHNRMLYFSDSIKKLYGIDLYKSVNIMVVNKELRNISNLRKGRTEAFDVYAMREIVRNAKSTVGKMLGNMLSGGDNRT